MNDNDGLGADARCAPVIHDLAFEAVTPPDFPPGTGDPCAVDEDCPMARNGTRRCLHQMWGFPLEDGYCSSACRVDGNDTMTGVNPDCPGGWGTCHGADGASDGDCYQLCGHLDGVLRYCRFAYNCEGLTDHRNWIGYVLACQPAGVRRECDPFTAKSCGAGRTCVLYGTDVVGLEEYVCEKACDPRHPPADASCNCKRTFIGEGWCAPPLTEPVGPGDECAVHWNVSPQVTCPSSYDCSFFLGEPPPRCRRYCTQDTAERDCGPCVSCEGVAGGVGLCNG